MRLILIVVQCTALASFISADTVNFDKPQDVAVIPKLFESRMGKLDLQNYPLAIEAVMSVALKLQAIDDRNGKQTNFLVSPLAVAGALGQLMMGARGELRKQIAILLTLSDQAQYNITNISPVEIGGRIGNTKDANPTRSISPENAWAYEGKNLKTRQFDASHQNGLPGLEMHRQLGRLILDLSSPLPEPGHPQSLKNSSYLHTSSAFFVDQNIEIIEPFVLAISDFYNSQVVPLDFRNRPVDAQNEVNQWGSTHTGGLISNFLAYPPPIDTAVIQATAVHFRGAWQTPFVPEGTFSGKFKTSENTNVPVKLMRGSFEDAFYAENETLGIRLLAMPYSKFDSAMYVILPMDTNPLKFNISHLISQLSPTDLAGLVAIATSRTVNVMFPKLSLSSSLNIASALEEHAAYLNDKIAQINNTVNDTIRSVPLNENSLPTDTQQDDTHNPQTTPEQSPLPLSNGTENGGSFTTPGANTDSQESSQKSTLILNAASKNSRFRVSDIIQQIALEVNEAGTEAAAIAGSTVNYSGDVKSFMVNRPFFFFIRHEATGAMLFWGTVVDPSA